MELLIEWGVEILFALVSAGVVGYFKYQGDKLKTKLKDYEILMSQKENKETEAMIESRLEPIYEELEDLRTYIRETQNTEKAHMSLIIASYRYRLIQLCKEFLRQEYMTQDQYDQLTEFYKLYVGLGGNGQAQTYYDKTIKLPIREEEE